MTLYTFNDRCTAISNVSCITTLVGDLPAIEILELNFASLTEVNDQGL